MKKEQREKLYNELVEVFDESHQCLLCVEEMTELSKELLKFERGYEDEKQIDKIAEETADVLITIEQIMRIYEIEDDVLVYREQKLNRTKQRLERYKAKLNDADQFV